MIPNRYNLENLQEALVNPSMFVDEVKRLPERSAREILYSAQNKFFEYRYGKGVDFMEEDWDNLIILDACRYDTFASLYRKSLSGDLQYRISKGAHSWEFMQGNFVGKSLHDTVYVTGNAHTSKLNDDVFHAIFSVEIEELQHKPQYAELIDNQDVFSRESYAVFPEDVVEVSLKANEQFPGKRHIVHFMQPHTPHIGERGLEMYRRILEQKHALEVDLDGRFGDINIDLSRNFGTIARNEEVDVGEALLREAYAETLELVLDHVGRLVSELPGRTVITADHGELLGEKVSPFYRQKEFGHPHQIRTAELCKVPWLVIDGEERREVTAEEPVISERLGENDVGDQLRALGYKE